MRYYVEQEASEFEFWGGALERMNGATPKQQQEIFERLEEYFEDGEYSQTDINDFVWFECDDIFFNDEE